MNSALRTISLAGAWRRSIYGLLMAILFAFPSALPAQAPTNAQQRDLKVEKDVPVEIEDISGNKLVIPRSYALVIGVGNYPNLQGNFQLQYAEKDAESIYSVLISPEGGNFRAENVKRLVGEEATLENIRRELEEWLPSVAQPEDRVLIYFAGHGFLYQGGGYLAPYDFRIEDPSKYGYPMQNLGEVIGGKIQARWKVLLTDSCHSGVIAPEDSAQLNSRLLNLNTSLFSLTASRDREQSFESIDFGGGHGAFTYYVVKGMEGLADENTDSIVTADELAEYVRRNVREATQGAQNPTSDRGSFDKDMLLAYIPSNKAMGSAPAPKFGTLVFETNRDGVEVFVNDRSVGVVNKDEPLRLPGLTPGVHRVRAVKMGFEPDGPREEVVYPGQEKTVTIKILIPRRRNRAAIDKFESGIEKYNKGYAKNYQEAAADFQQALALDPKYSQAALYLARTYNALFDQDKARRFFQKAIEIDPDYLEARASFAGMLLDIGDLDESIRQLNVVTQRDKRNGMAWYLQSQAYLRKDLFKEAVTSARRAVDVAPDDGESHFWLAQSLRMNGDYTEAIDSYQRYLRLSDFNSKLAGNLNYYVLGFLAGIGKKKRAAQQDIWKELRSQAWFGICDAGRKLNKYGEAIEACREALRYDSADPFTHYALGLSYARQANLQNDPSLCAPAIRHFETMLELNPDLEEADFARKNLTALQQACGSAKP
ncbi:MAG: tetratricopeptide repeat protein [Bryobacterales bacterium]|jgi:tetratricopeptide (TPR) repeat protein|nr:tetratricopeptide repeat protein [Bryobacterales bacterium]